jgi:NAD(P)-dependent dehydrogenase (short-subunit alcohol dehydrogenase family)
MGGGSHWSLECIQPCRVASLVGILSPSAVLITGCSSGIGYACAHGLRERGYRVFATARRIEDVQALRGEGLQALQLDVTSTASIDATLGQIFEQTGGELYGLFNNAGYGQPGAVEDLSRDALRDQFETNLFGLHELTCRVIPAMRRKGHGRIIHNSSMLGYVAMPFRGAYIASKFALEGLTDTLRLELRGSGIHVSLIEPGPIDSRFRDNAHRAFLRHNDPRQGPHASAYQSMIARLTKEGPAQPFTLPAKAILRPLIHALESPRPRNRYPVTVPAHLFWMLRRLLPTAALDRLLIGLSGGGRR